MIENSVPVYPLLFSPLIARSINYTTDNDGARRGEVLFENILRQQFAALGDL